MIVDLRGLRTQVVVGGQTLTNQFEELIGSDDYLAETGLVAFKGSLKLCEVWGGFSLDDWAGVEWLKLGTAIEVDIDLGAGLVRHPRGKLYIQGTTYKSGSNSLEVACILGARSFAEPVDETKIQGTTATAIVNQLFQLAGCGLPVWNSTQTFNLCERPQISGSYLESAGKILASMGLLAVADGQGVVQIYPVESAGLLLSIDESELSDMERVLVGQPPSSRALISGSYRVCHDRAATTFTNTETRGNISAIVPGGAGYGTVSRTTISETIDVENSLISRQQVEGRIGFQVYKGRSGLPKTSLVSSATETGSKQYSTGSDAKLLYSQSSTSSPAYAVLQGYCDWAIENKKPVFLSTGVTAQRERVTYTYDDREQLIEVVKEIETPIGTILAGLGGVDWEKIDEAYGLPSELVLSDRETIQWQEVAPGEWRKVTIKEFSQCRDANGQAGLQERLSNAKDSELLGIYRQAAACSASTVAIEESNSGQANPPNAERFPTQMKTEAKQVEIGVQFQGFADSLDPRAKAYTCPHFPDVHGAESVKDFAYNYGATWHGVTLRRWQSVRVEMPYRSELLNYRPYAQIEVATATGTYRLAMNGTSWAISPDKALVSSDCSLIGRVPSPGVVIAPFMPTPGLAMRLGLRLGLELNDYEPESATMLVNLGLRLNLNFADSLALRLGLRLPLVLELETDIFLAFRLGLNLRLQSSDAISLALRLGFSLPFTLPDDSLALRLGFRLNLSDTPVSRYSSTIVAPSGTTGLTQIVSSGADDASISIGNIGFDFLLYDGTYRTNIFVGSNSYLTFGFGSNVYSGISFNNPGRGLFVGAADRSWNQVWVGSGATGTYRVRWVGNASTSGAGLVVWEVTLFSDGVIMLVTGNSAQTGGYSALTKGINPAVETTYTLIANSSWVFLPNGSGSYTVQTGSYF